MSAVRLALAMCAIAMPSGPGADVLVPERTRRPYVPFIEAGCEPARADQLVALAAKRRRSRQGKRGKR